MFDQHPFYPVTEEDKKLIRAELGLKESTIQEDVDSIMDWFSKQPHLVEAGINRKIVENLLIIAKGSIEKTKGRIDNLYKYRSYAPELIQNREKILNSSDDIWNPYIQLPMPRLYNGNRITMVKFTDSDASNFSSEILFRNAFMLGDVRLNYDYALSDIWVVDMKNTTFSHMLKMNPIIMQKTSQIFHEGLGIRVHAIHVLNANSLLQHTVTFMRQFFSAKIMDRLVIHESINDLHKHLPKKYLPKDYGGEEPYLSEFKDKYEKEIRSTKTKTLLIESSKLISNESRRPNAEKNEDYIVGSFRKLDFD